MFFSLQKIIVLLITYKYAIIFPIAVIEGPAVSIIAWLLAQTGYVNDALIVFGDMVGNTIYSHLIPRSFAARTPVRKGLGNFWFPNMILVRST